MLVYGPVRGFMVWNLFLAIVPTILALALFRRARARRPLGPVFWCGLVAWLLFLPNAPYVLTDVKHMVESLHASRSYEHSYLVIGTYSIFFALGLLSYVASLHLFRRFLHTTVDPRVVAPILLAVHGMCVVAMYIGRVMRLNSWDAVLRPGHVLVTVVRVPQPFTIALLGTMFVVVGVAAFVTMAAGSKLLAELRRFR